MLTLFRQFAAYNRWANARLFAAALALPEEAYRRPVGVFFGSLHGTLNHILVADRIWLHRITGQGRHPGALNATLFDDRMELTRARIAEDARLSAVVDGCDETALARTVSYANSSGKIFEQSVGDILPHLFNHQTHHRGHAHAAYSIVTDGSEPPSLDLVAFQRGLPAPDLANLV